MKTYYMSSAFINLCLNLLTLTLTLHGKDYYYHHLKLEYRDIQYFIYIEMEISGLRYLKSQVQQ